MELVFEWTFRRWQIMRDIYTSSREKYTSITELTKELDVSRENPTLLETLSYLFDAEALVVTEIIGSCKIIRINKDKLRKILDDSPIFKEFVDYISQSRVIYKI